jgi:hypothetical protein
MCTFRSSVVTAGTTASTSTDEERDDDDDDDDDDGGGGGGDEDGGDPGGVEEEGGVTDDDDEGMGGGGGGGGEDGGALGGVEEEGGVGDDDDEGMGQSSASRAITNIPRRPPNELAACMCLWPRRMYRSLGSRPNVSQSSGSSTSPSSPGVFLISSDPLAPTDKTATMPSSPSFPSRCALVLSLTLWFQHICATRSAELTPGIKCSMWGTTMLTAVLTLISGISHRGFHIILPFASFRSTVMSAAWNAGPIMMRVTSFKISGGNTFDARRKIFPLHACFRLMCANIALTCACVGYQTILGAGALMAPVLVPNDRP